MVRVPLTDIVKSARYAHDSLQILHELKMIEHPIQHRALKLQSKIEAQLRQEEKVHENRLAISF